MDQPSMRKSDGKIRLVLVEDYKLIRIGIRMVLIGDEDLEVLGEAESGQQGLQMVKDLEPDLVILDLGLPDIDGLQLTREIRKFNRNVKILILTSHETEEEVIMALAAGANAYCLKDIVSERLIQVVKSVCEGAVWLDPRVASRALQVFSESANKRALYNRMALTERERWVLVCTHPRRMFAVFYKNFRFRIACRQPLRPFSKAWFKNWNQETGLY
jgi:DNA-binding NarL/FixJ family response regulator